MAIIVNLRYISPWIEIVLGKTPEGTYIPENFADIHQIVYNLEKFEKSLKKLDIKQKYKYPHRPSGTKIPFEGEEEENKEKEKEEAEKKEEKKKNKKKNKKPV